MRELAVFLLGGVTGILFTKLFLRAEIQRYEWAKKQVDAGLAELARALKHGATTLSEMDRLHAEMTEAQAEIKRFLG